MPIYKNVKIVMKKWGEGEIYIDGKKIKGATRFNLSGGVEEMTELILSVLVRSVDVDVSQVNILELSEIETQKMNDTQRCSVTPLMDIIPTDEAKLQEYGDKVAKENSAAVKELAAGKRFIQIGENNIPG